MKLPDLLTFVRTKMRMEHVYQPLLIKLLLEAGGSATVTQLARGFAAADESSVRFYEQRIRSMPLRVLRGRKVVLVENGVVRLNATSLTYGQKTSLMAACEERIAEFVTQRGDDVWVALGQADPVPSSMRFKVLKRDRICQLCGSGPKDSPLEVDHIVPRSKGGSNEMSNLQVLCRPCNQGKSNSDDTKFSTAD